jgi:hypothetical protein
LIKHNLYLFDANSLQYLARLNPKQESIVQVSVDVFELLFQTEHPLKMARPYYRFTDYESAIKGEKIKLETLRFQLNHNKENALIDLTADFEVRRVLYPSLGCPEKPFVCSAIEEETALC